MKRVAILQSNYIPWKGYFDQIDSVDEFVVYDRVDYTKHDWRNRNVIKTPQGLRWLTIPVLTKGLDRPAIDEVTIVDHHWAAKHWKSIAQSYSRAPGFTSAEPCLADLYDRAAQLTHLHDVNLLFLEELCRFIGIDTPITDSRDYECRGDPTERLVDICRQAACTHYVTGPAARDYLDEQCFADAGIEVEYFTYDYDEYPQPHGEFVHSVSIVDTLAALGADTRSVLRGGGLRPGPSRERSR
jgi:hypothetical protein